MTTRIRPGATHYLTGIHRGTGTCDHCRRPLKNLFTIADASGAEMTVGRSHARQFTGWTPTVAEAERAQYLTDRAAAWEAYATRSQVGAALAVALTAELVATASQPHAGPCERAQLDIAEGLMGRGRDPRSRWDDRACDSWARRALAA